MGTYAEVLREVWLCSDCMIVQVNDDATGIESEARVEAVYRGLRELADSHPNPTAHVSMHFDPETGDGCEDFSACACGACGTRLAGARYRFAIVGHVEPAPRGARCTDGDPRIVPSTCGEGAFVRWTK
jgi:hypothetical protein